MMSAASTHPDLDFDQRKQIALLLRRCGFSAGEYAPVTMRAQFPQVIIVTRFAPRFPEEARAILADELAEIAGKPVMLRDKRVAKQDKIIQAAQLEKL